MVASNGGRANEADLGVPYGTACALLKITGLVSGVQPTGSRTRCGVLRGGPGPAKRRAGKGPGGGWPDLLPTAAPA
jgi:hypothetical protein